MARINALPSLEIIRGFKGILDFYLWRGLACVRKWPYTPPANRSPAMRAASALFRAIIKGYALLGALHRAAFQEDAADQPRTARDIFVSAVLGHLHEASMSDFLTLLQQSRDFLEDLTALLNTLDSVDLDEIVVNVDESVLPFGAATQATLATRASEAKLELNRLLLVSIAAEDFATQVTLAALLTELALKADLTETQPISAAALPLPALAATAANQASALAAMITQAAAPVIYNVVMTLANTEYNQVLPANTLKFMIKCQTAYAIRVAFAAGQTAVAWTTVASGAAYWEDLIQDVSLTLYFRCATAGQRCEITAWS